MWRESLFGTGFPARQILDQWYGTELAPLLNMDRVEGIFMILMENGSATFSLLNKVYNSI